MDRLYRPGMRPRPFAPRFPYSALCRSRIGEALAGAELLDRRLAVVGRVGPVARRIEREIGIAHACSPVSSRRQLPPTPARVLAARTAAADAAAAHTRYPPVPLACRRAA